MKLQKLAWILFAILAIMVGVYPWVYYFVDMHDKGLMGSKSKELLDNAIWHTAFYTHITFGGIALLTGWSQFSSKFRIRYISRHRLVGKVYVVCVMLSSLAGLYIAFYASGGIIAKIGFGLLAISWFVTIVKAYTSILERKLKQHENWMIRNYALTFAAVTLRIYLPLLSNLVFHDFIPAYRIVAWLAWIPNLIIAEIIVSRRKNKPVYMARVA